MGQWDTVTVVEIIRTTTRIRSLISCRGPGSNRPYEAMRFKVTEAPCHHTTTPFESLKSAPDQSSKCLHDPLGGSLDLVSLPTNPQ